MSASTDVYADLKTEGDALDQIVAGLDAGQWDLPTPARGWTIKHQVAHLSSTARLAGIAASDPELFAKVTVGADKDFDGAVAALLTPYLEASPADLLARWRAERDEAVKALSALPPAQMVPWVARDIPASALACAGLMELFAHGQDIYDTIGAPREYTEFRYEFTAPSGTVWAFGPEDAENRIAGPAVDFCMLVTRRRNRADLAVTATGADADQWLDIAQAYRGSPGPGREPGQFANK